MAELSDTTYDVIVQRVTVTITDVQLQSELIDHCCCAVEELMNLGMPCEEAIDQAFLRLAPHGLHEIEVAFNNVLKPSMYSDWPHVQNHALARSYRNTGRRQSVAFCLPTSDSLRSAHQQDHNPTHNLFAHTLWGCGRNAGGIRHLFQDNALARRKYSARSWNVSDHVHFSAHLFLAALSQRDEVIHYCH